MGDRSLILNSGAKSTLAESYRTLRTNVMFSSIDKSIKSIAVTSAGPSEGKSTVVSNFAIALAQDGSRVLIIDSDLRKPKVHKLFALPNNIGLTNILTERLPWEEHIASVEELPNLYVMTSGPIPPNPSEIVGSEKMRSMVSELKESFDFVLLDTPPVGVVTDAAIVSSYADGTILVVASGNVEIEAAQRAKELLVNVKANILGVVLNKISIKGAGYYKYYYYGGYYEDESHRKKKKGRRDQ
ncbi:MAG: CpsD/CapB family tyrosine-protein kinase [Lutispora sp.]|nr:CpsD/CapB family tyrosine-protein kinase [Lutispora sp.]